MYRVRNQNRAYLLGLEVGYLNGTVSHDVSVIVRKSFS